MRLHGSIHENGLKQEEKREEEVRRTYKYVMNSVVTVVIHLTMLIKKLQQKLLWSEKLYTPHDAFKLRNE